jgi:hypothetical protein
VTGKRSGVPAGTHRKSISSSNLKLLAAAPVIVGVSAWTMFAGGGAKTCKVDASRAAAQICGPAPGPANVDVKIDTTMFRGDRRVAKAAADAAASYAEVPIEYGGTVQITEFGRTASRSRVLFQAEIPTRDELRLSQRAGLQNDLRTKIKAALSRLGSGDSDREFAAGSDILGAYTLPSTAPLKPGLPLLRVALTDGRVQVPGFSLVSVLRRKGFATALRELAAHLPKARGPKPDGLVIAGVGGTGGLIPDEDPAMTDSLTVIHERLCKGLARTCRVTSTL